MVDRIDASTSEARRLEQAVFQLDPHDDAGFEALRVQVEAYQRSRSPFYDRFCESLSVARPYLPVEAFGLTPIATFPEDQAEAVFESSGTSGQRRSVHYLRSLDLYARAVTTEFVRHFGRGPFVVLAHLPFYERSGRRSSLVTMARILIDSFGATGSGFLHEDIGVLRRAVESARFPMVLLGAAFGLLDLIDRDQSVVLGSNDVVIETGGMKTTRRELERNELHDRLAAGFGIRTGQVWSEYGMCELCSQFYMRDQLAFRNPAWVRFAVVGVDDPTHALPPGRQGRLAITDLANIHTVSSLLTSDRAVGLDDGFVVLGRLSGAQLRGCNYLFETARDVIDAPG